MYSFLIHKRGTITFALFNVTRLFYEPKVTVKVNIYGVHLWQAILMALMGIISLNLQDTFKWEVLLLFERWGILQGIEKLENLPEEIQMESE